MLGALTRSHGFSLLEVMIALVVLSVGLLGILKLEASAVSSTNIAAKRSIAALEAASLAATPKPAIAATFSVPERRRRSCPPPVRRGS